MGLIFIDLVSLEIVLVTLYALLSYKKISQPLKSFCWFIFLSGAVEAISKILFYKAINNLPLLHIYVAIGCILLARFYERVLDGYINKNIIRSMTIVFLLFTIVNSIFIQPLTTFNSYALTLESIIIVILTLTTFIVMMDDVVKQRRREMSAGITWINSGLFIYFSSSLVIFQLQFFFDADRTFKFFSREFNIQAWMLHAFFSMIMYFCFFMGLWRSIRANQKQDSY